MMGNYSEFDIIQKAIHHTYHLLERDDTATAAVYELKSAREQYLQALSHRTLIDAHYLKFIVK
ncbi:MAG: DUF3921 family protein [Ectobacillus sp.]